MLLIAKLRIRSSWCGCSSGEGAGRITSACRVVSLSHRSTAIIASSVGSASSSLWPAGVDSTGLPATVISALIWPSPGVAISSARHDTGTCPNTSLAPRTRVRNRPNSGAPSSRPGIGCTVTDHAAARDVEMTGQDVDDVDEPASQAAELLVAGADPAVHHRARRGCQLTGQPADALGVDGGDRGHPFR